MTLQQDRETWSESANITSNASVTAREPCPKASIRLRELQSAVSLRRKRPWPSIGASSHETGSSVEKKSPLSANSLGVGAWGKVYEGTFRGCQVAVKQIHELILSPHNRRLFEREM
ncbi:hypothetical protein OS493_040618, partial [Desmophyllum pertusum]